MKYGNGISKSKNHQAVPDDRILQFAVPLTARHPLTGPAEQRQGKNLHFPGNKYRGPVIDRRNLVWYDLTEICPFSSLKCSPQSAAVNPCLGNEGPASNGTDSTSESDPDCGPGCRAIDIRYRTCGNKRPGAALQERQMPGVRHVRV